MAPRTGSIRTLVTCFLLIALGGCADEGVVAVKPEASPNSKELPTSYNYVLKASCGERGFLGRYQVSVRDTVVTSVRSLNPEYEYRPSLDDVPTLAGLLERAVSASPGAVVDLQLDESGIPTSLSIDHVPNAIDDEECYEISELAVTEP